MSPAEFSAALEQLTYAGTIIATLPLAEMTEYIDTVERIGEDNPAFTPQRQEIATHAARIIAAATHMREAIALGGDTA